MNGNQAKSLDGRNIRKRVLLKQACFSKSTAELEVDSRGTLLLISTPRVKLVTRPCVLCKQGYHVPEKPRLLKEHLYPIQPSVITKPWLSITNSTDMHRFSYRSPPCETDIKRKLNAIPDSPLAGKTVARGRGGVQKGRQLEIWSYHRHSRKKSPLNYAAEARTQNPLRQLLFSDLSSRWAECVSARVTFQIGVRVT